MSLELKIKKIHSDAVIPSYVHEGDAGFDLVSVEDYVLRPGERRAIGTGLQVEIPEGYEMQIRPRSGLAFKQGVTVLNSPGTIDVGYRGEIKVILVNHGDGNYEVKKCERIAQGVINELPKVTIVEVSELSETARGEGGFGSTGK